MSLPLALLLAGCQLVPTDPDAPEAPEVVGEESAGHLEPTWLWSTPEGAEAFRFRVDEGDWTVVGDEITSYTAEEELALGAHTLEVQASNGGDRWSESGTFTTTIELYEQGGYWDGVAHPFHLAPSGRRVGVACHNCYVEDLGDSDSNLEATREKLLQAEAAGADLLELDIRVEGGAWYVSHDDDGSTDAALLDDVLAETRLQAASQPLFVEIKEKSPTEADIRALLDALVAHGYAVNGRPVLLRAFSDRGDNLTLAQGLLDEYPLNAHYLRFHVLFQSWSGSDVPAFQALIDQAVADGADGVEFNHQTGGIGALVAYAHGQGLSASLWTFSEDAGEVLCGAWRHAADAVITDSDLTLCGDAIEASDEIAWLDVRESAPEEAAISYLTGESWVEADAPLAESAVFPGTVLAFDGTGNVVLDDLPALDGGVLLATAVSFDTVTLTEGEIMQIVDGDVRLELTEEGLVFAVQADGTWHEAVAGIGRLKADTPYVVVGARETDGAAQLWINGGQSSVTPSAEVDGPISSSGGTWTLGDGFLGEIQWMSLRSW